MKLFAEFRNEKNPRYYLVELQYSSLHWLAGEKRWFCRIWRKDWLQVRVSDASCAYAYGDNKFQAYRLALKEFEKIK